MRSGASRCPFFHLAFALIGCLAVGASVFAQAPQAGYSVITARQGSRLPVASALFSFRFGGVLSAEAGVPAVAPIRAGRLFVDESNGGTGVALANSSDQSVNATLTLRNATGGHVTTQQLTIPARQQVARYVNQLATNLPAGFVGSLTFECQGSGRLAAVAVRQGANGRNQPIFATLPVADLDSVGQGTSIVFPHIGAGGGILSTQILLINPTGQRITGRIQLFGTDGNPLTLQLDGQSGSDFAYTLEPEGTFQGRLTRNGGALAGYAVITVTGGNALPSGTALFQFRDSGGALDSEAGVGAIPSTTRSRIFVDVDQTNTGVAIANTNAATAAITFELFDRNGISIRSTTRNIVARGQLAIFATELFAGLPAGFTGLMEIRSNVAVFPVTLKLTLNSVGANILTTLPVADLTRPPTATLLVFPQVGFGGGLETRLIFINTDTQAVARVRINFTASAGTPLQVPITGTTNSQFDVDFVAGGGGQLRPGNSATIAEIVVDPANPISLEVSVMMGKTGYLRPSVVDTGGRVRDDFPFTFNSLATDVATVDSLGRIEPKKLGFATCTINSGGNVATATISVVNVSAGSSGFQITGITEDPSRRVYMADSNHHTILLAQDLQETPQRVAGITDSVGSNNGPALSARFNSPTFIAFNRADGSLYVADTNNHVIRVMRRGQVELFAGSPGQQGNSDGTLANARFRRPQGLAIDSRGFLWVVDSGNNTIRRISLATGMVSTVAGSPSGSGGSADGKGSAARFQGPVGIAVVTEPLSAQLARQTTGAPPPPVSVVVTDTGNNLMRRILEDGTTSTITADLSTALAGLSDRSGKPILTATRFLEGPRGVAVDAAGNIYVSETSSNRVRSILNNGSVVPVGPADIFSQPGAVAISNSGRVLVADGNLAGREITYGAPIIDSINPSTISVSQNVNVSITGSNFAPESKVLVGGVLIANPTVNNTRSITFRTPNGLPSGEMTVTVLNRGGLAQRSLRLTPVPLANLARGRVTTVAGGSTYVGDGLPATQGILTRPAVTTLDANGNLFVSDFLGNRVRRIDAMTGVITTVAGTGRLGFLGDGELAVTAQMSLPLGVAVDRSGNVFISDSINLRVRRVDARTGIISTVAGTGEYGFSGDGGQGTAAALSRPLGLAVDAFGNLFIADSDVIEGETGNSVIRRLDAATGVISTVAGRANDAGFSGDNGQAIQARLNAPAGLAFDAAGNLYIGDTGNNRVRLIEAGGNGRIDPTDTIRSVAGNGQSGFSGDGGAATAARLNGPGTLAVDQSGNLYIADTGNNRIRRVAGNGNISTFAGTGVAGFSGDGGFATQAAFDNPIGVSVDAGGNVFIGDLLNDRVRRVDSMTGRISSVAGSGDGGPLGDGGPAIYAGFGIAQGLGLDRHGNLLVADYLGSVIRRIQGNGLNASIQTVAGNGNLDYTGDGGLATNAALQTPSSIAIDADGNMYIADQGNNVIRRVDATDGRISTIAGNGVQGYSGDDGFATAASLSRPDRLLLDGTGNLVVNDSGNNRIRAIGAYGVIRTVAGNGDIDLDCFFGTAPQVDVPATSIPMGAVDGLALDAAGNLILADTLCNRLRLVLRDGPKAGYIYTIAGNGCNPFLQQCPPFEGVPASEVSLFFPSGIVLDAANNVFVSDLFRVVKIDTVNGFLQNANRIAGADVGFGGDGSDARNAAFLFPRDMAVANDGTLYVADSANGRIRAIPGVAALTLFFDDIEDLEASGGNWLTNGTWVFSTDRAYSGRESLFAEDVDAINDQVLFMTPTAAMTIPANATLARYSFRHYFSMEAAADSQVGYDGGVLEISTNGGSSWFDAAPYFVSGAYNRVLSAEFQNPLGGRAAFSGDSGGFFASELDLMAFRGQRVRIRFRLVTDASVGAEGWYVDDARLTALVP